MTSRSTAKLAVVPKADSAPAEISPEDNLRVLLPALAGAEMVVARVRAAVSEEGRKLAKQRGVAFIREEHLRREFGRSGC